MRRKDREMDVEFAKNIIDKSAFGVLGINKEEPYTMPLSIVRRENILYFHSAPQGRKVDMISDGDAVSVSFVGDVNVPSLLNRETIQEKINEGKFAEIGSKVFTTEFESTHVKGRIYKVESEVEAIVALNLIVRKYTPDLEDLAEKFIKNSLPRTVVYKILIDEIHGKRKKFDSDGVEMKFGRMG